MKLVEDVQTQLVSELLSSQNICKLIYNTKATALDEPFSGSPSLLRDRNVFDYKYIPEIQETAKNYITMGFLSDDSIYNHNLTVAIYVTVHEKNMRLFDGRNRLFALSTEIIKLLDKPIFQNTLPGIGRWKFAGMSDSNIAQFHYSLALIYEVVDIAVD